MELRHLRYFIAVAEELNFSRAADRLHMAQPPLSQQIRALETELGVQLLERDQRPLQLTQAGQAFLQEARLVLAQADQAVQIAQRASRGEVGRLAIGFNSSATQSVLPEILRCFQSRFAGVELRLFELESQAQLQTLQFNQIDCGFLHSQPYDDTVLCSLSVFKEPLIVALPEQHPIAAQHQIPLKALAPEAFILPPPQMGQGFYQQIMALCEDAGFRPTVVQQARWLQTVLGLVAGGIGIALVPASMRTLQRAGVVYREVQTAFTIETIAVWRRRDRSPVLQEFLKVVHELSQTLFNQVDIK